MSAERLRRGDESVGPAAPGRGWRLFSRPVIGWVLYDFANTIFSYAVLTRFFNEWVVIDRGRPDWYVGLMGFCVSVALVLALPLLGAVADRTGRRKPILVAATLGCVTGTALLGLTDSVLLALLVAGVAIFCFNAAEAQYHPLLATVAPPRRQGTVSGLGVGVGYVGGLGALLLLGAIAGEDNQRAFLPTATLFLVFALPCFLWVRERAPTRATGPVERAGVAAEAFRLLLEALREARRRPHGRFLIARFLYVDAIATVIAFTSIYARRVGEFSSAQVNALIALAAVFAIAGAIAAGLVAERLGPKRVLTAVLLIAAGTFLASGASGSPMALWVLAPVVGASLASVWATDRVFLLRLSPPERRGEVFGLYTLVGKVSSGVGPFVLWGGTVWLLSQALGVADAAEASRAALCVLGVSALAGLALLRPLSDAERRPAGPRAAPAA